MLCAVPSAHAHAVYLFGIQLRLQKRTIANTVSVTTKLIAISRSVSV
jgi:hypothetical protein